MILDVLVYRNKAAKCFTNPFYSQEKIENLQTNHERAIVLGGPQAKAKFKNLVLYNLGTFDDEKGIFVTHEPDMLFDCDDIIAAIPEEK